MICCCCRIPFRIPWCRQPCASFNSSGSEGPGSADKKRRFEAMRKQHYNMKQALQQVRMLVAAAAAAVAR
jgi:hypothetical protein